MDLCISMSITSAISSLFSLMPIISHFKKEIAGVPIILLKSAVDIVSTVSH